jgi:N-acetylneuraminate synthase/sialic acid synthase
MRSLTIDGRTITDDGACYLIAEIGSNHGGDPRTAVRMIAAAAAAGADAVKFQKRDNATLYSAALLARPYDHEHSFGRTYGEHRENLEFEDREYERIAREARMQRVTWFATAFDEASADFLMCYDVPAFKIASGGLTDLALLRHVARFDLPIILSTGGGTWADVDRAVDVLTCAGVEFALLHCTAAYPAAFEDLNLRCIATMRDRYPDTVIGWSCHVHNLSMLMQAHAYGARILEVHFTLNRSSKGTDHAFALEPATLTKLRKDLDRARLAAGDGEKRWYESERQPIAKMRRIDTPDGLRITGELTPDHQEADPAAPVTRVGN